MPGLHEGIVSNKVYALSALLTTPTANLRHHAPSSLFNYNHHLFGQVTRASLNKIHNQTMLVKPRPAPHILKRQARPLEIQQSYHPHWHTPLLVIARAGATCNTVKTLEACTKQIDSWAYYNSEHTSTARRRSDWLPNEQMASQAGQALCPRTQHPVSLPHAYCT
jgi:hypothetical protein